MAQKTAFWIIGITLLVILMIIGFGAVSFLVLSSLQERAYQVPTLDPAVISTQAAQTVIAEITRQALANDVKVTNTFEPSTPNPAT